MHQIAFLSILDMIFSLAYPQTTTRALPLDPAGGQKSPRPLKLFLRLFHSPDVGGLE